MLRLFSDRRKVGSAVFEETNPFPGKAKALTESLGWTNWTWGFKLQVMLMQKLGLGRWFPAEYLKDPRSYVPQAFGGRGLLVLPGITRLLPDALKYCIVNSDNIAVRIANGSGDSRRLRGVILDESDRPLMRLQELNIEVFTPEKAREEASSADLASFGEMSMTSLNNRVNEDFVDYSRFDLTEKKVAVIAKAFAGPTVLKEEQKSYEGRMRSVARAQSRIYISRGSVPSPVEVENAIMQPWVAIRKLYVRRSDVMALIPRGIVPSFTIPMAHLEGSMSLIEMERRVLSQPSARTDVLALTEQDAMSESLSSQGTSLPYSESE